MTNSIGDLKYAEVILLIGSNTSEQHPVIAAEILKGVDKGAKIIVVDPRRIFLNKFAIMHLRLKPGTDAALLNGMMNAILSENLQNSKFINERTEGFEELKASVQKYTPEYVSQITGVPAEDIRSAARIYAKASRASIIYCMGVTQHISGTGNVMDCANLAMLCGQIGREGTGVNPLRGQQNVQGACDMGGLPNYYTGYQRTADEAARQKFEKAWNTKLPTTNGLTVVEMMNAAIDGKLKALYVMGENPLISDPDINHVRHALDSLDFLVVQDIFMTETAKLADVVLPACSFAEKDGTFSNTERRIQRVRKAIEPLGNSRADWEIVCDVAQRMGANMKYDSPSAIMEEVASLTPIYGGVHYDRLENGGLQWPCPANDHPGTKILHGSTFSRGKGKFCPVEYVPPAESASEDYPFTLTTGRLYYHYHTRSMTGRSETLNRESPDGYIEINPADAKVLNIRNGNRLKVSSKRGHVVTRAVITDAVPAKTLFMPFNFADAAANLLTNPALDPVAKIPELKVCAVKLERSE